MRTDRKRRRRAAIAAAVGVSVFAAIANTPPAPAQDAPKTGWIRLFNGKDLSGWTPKVRGYALGENYANTFRVEGGVLKVGYDGYPRFDGKFGHLFFHRPFSHYRLRVEYRFVGDQCPGGPGWAFRNSGVMIHSQAPGTMRKDQEFPVSIEVQYLGGGPTGARPTANVCTPGTHIVMGGKLITEHCTNSTARTYRGDEWVTVEVEVHGGGTIKHIVEGRTVLEYEKPQLDTNDRDAVRLVKSGDTLLTGGYLALQAESHPIEFRKVELLPLDD